jgi:ABC-2 type transport system permease protein
MNRLLIKKNLHESSLLFAACSCMLIVFCWARVWIVCQFDLEKFKPILGQLKRFEKFSPVPLEQLLTYPGSIGMSFSEPVLLLCILVWSIARGSDVVSGELGRGTLEMLLSRPISRLRLMVMHALTGYVGLAGLCLCVWLGLHFGIQWNNVQRTVEPQITMYFLLIPIEIPFPLGEPRVEEIPLTNYVDSSLFVLPSLNLFAFGAFVFALSSLLSSFDRYRWRTIGVVISFYVIELLIFLLSRTVVAARFFENFTFFSLYQPDATVIYAQRFPAEAWLIFAPAETQSTIWPYDLAPLGMVFVLLVMTAILHGLAAVCFRRRDLPAPL